MHLQPVPALPPPRLSGIAVVARQDRTFSNTKFAAQPRCRHLETAKALGITAALLARADEVIE